jgi:hypothetical protein
MDAELLPNLVLISYAQSGKCNERQANNYADSSVFIRSTKQIITNYFHLLKATGIDVNTRARANKFKSN